MPEYIYQTVASFMSNLTSIATIGVEAWIGKIKGLREKILRGTNWLENRGCAYGREHFRRIRRRWNRALVMR